MNLNIGTTYSFEVYPTSVLGNNFRNLKLLAVLDAETTRYMNYDPAVMHAKVYPTLPEGTPDNYLSYSYYKFVNESGQNIIVGMPWIKESSVVAVTADFLWVKVNTTADQINAVRSSLTSNGFAVAEVKVGDPI